MKQQNNFRSRFLIYVRCIATLYRVEWWKTFQNEVFAEPEIWTVQLVRAFAFTISRIESSSEVQNISMSGTLIRNLSYTHIHLEITTRHENDNVSIVVGSF